MNDRQANVVVMGLLDLALKVRDEGPDACRAKAEQVTQAAGGDPFAALVIAAALIRTDLPVDAWWQQHASPQSVEAKQPCGTCGHLGIRHPRSSEFMCDVAMCACYGFKRPLVTRVTA